jgi:hypothetical protein
LVLNDLLSSFLLGLEAHIAILLGCVPTHQANHRTSGRAAGFLDIDVWNLCLRRGAKHDANDRTCDYRDI